jgi:hypothetical protein
MDFDRIALEVNAFANLPAEHIYKSLVGSPFPEITVDGRPMTGLRKNVIDILAFKWLIKNRPDFNGKDFKDAYQSSVAEALRSPTNLGEFSLYPSRHDLRYLFPKNLFGVSETPNELQNLLEEYGVELFDINSFYYLATMEEFLGAKVDLPRIINDVAELFRSNPQIYFTLEALLDLIRVEAYAVAKTGSYVEDKVNLLTVIQYYHRARQGLPLRPYKSSSEDVQKVLTDRWFQPDHAENLFYSYMQSLGEPEKIKKVVVLYALGFSTEHEQREHDNTPTEWLAKLLGDK